MQAVILAGGLGTRLRPLTDEVPKPMVLVKGRPFLEYELLYLSRNDFSTFIICTGYKANIIEDYFGDGSRFGISISYSEDGDKKLGPAGAMKKASELLEQEYMVTYGDSFLRLDYSAFEESFHSKGKLGMMSVLENHNQFGRSDIMVRNGMIAEYDKSRQSPEMNWINYGATMLRKKSLDFIPESAEFDEMQFYGELIKRNELAAFETFDRFYEIGTMSGLGQFEKFISENPQLIS
jgi:N-acetyl-alpha-D-muramate 1-phosphate uridylyltransferase